jgi:hypothetical protein
MQDLTVNTTKSVNSKRRFEAIEPESVALNQSNRRSIFINSTAATINISRRIHNNVDTLKM